MTYSRRGADDERNYQTVSRTLAVILQGKYAGRIDVYERGFARFEYDWDYDGLQLLRIGNVFDVDFCERYSLVKFFGV